MWARPMPQPTTATLRILLSVRVTVPLKPLLVAAAQHLPEAKCVVRPVPLGGPRRCGLRQLLHLFAEAKSTVCPIARRLAGLFQPVLEARLQRLGSGPLMLGGAGILGQCAHRPKLTADIRGREDQSGDPHHGSKSERV